MTVIRALCSELSILSRCTPHVPRLHRAAGGPVALRVTGESVITEELLDASTAELRCATRLSPSKTSVTFIRVLAGGCFSFLLLGAWIPRRFCHASVQQSWEFAVCCFFFLRSVMNGEREALSVR